MIRLLPPTFVPLILMLQLLPRAHHRRVAVDAMQLERLLMTTVLLSFWRWVWFCHAKLISLTSDQLSAYCCTVLSPDKGLDIYLYRLVSRSAGQTLVRTPKLAIHTSVSVAHSNPLTRTKDWTVNAMQRCVYIIRHCCCSPIAALKWNISGNRGLVAGLQIKFVLNYANHK